MAHARKLWLLLFVGVSSLSPPASAQDLWEISEGAETWEPLWDEGALLSPGRWTLSILGGRREGWLNTMDAPGRIGNEEQRVETYAMATLSLPFDTLFGSGAAQSPFVEAPVDDDPGVEGRLASNDALSKEFPDSEGDEEPILGAPSVAKAPQAQESRRQREPRDERVAEHRAREPAEDERRLLALVSELSHRVELGTGLRTLQHRLHHLGRRSRLSGLTPELRLRGVYGFDQTTSREDTTSIIPGETTTRGGRDSLAEVRLTFHLEHLLFNSQEVGIERQKTQAEAESRKMVTEALELFFDWKAADFRSRDPSLFGEERSVALVRAQTALARLHLMTQGWFRGWVTLQAFGLKPVAPDPGAELSHESEVAPR